MLSCLNAFLLLFLCRVPVPWHCAVVTSCVFFQKLKVVFLIFWIDFFSDKQFL